MLLPQPEFADEPERLAAAHLQVDAMEGADDPLSGVEVDRQAVQGDERVGAFRQCQPLRSQRKFSARKSMAKAGAACHWMSLRLAVKVAFWCSTV